MEFKNFKLVAQSNGLIRTIKTGKLNSWPDKGLYSDPKEVQKHFENQRGDFERYASELLDFIDLDYKHKSLLDVGTGFGWLVAEAEKRGYKAMGIDTSRVYVSAGKRHLKVNLQTTPLHKISQKFDVVVIKHVLEHIENLPDFLNAIKGVLKTRGVVVIAVPNIQSLMFWIFRERWYGLQPGQHVWQFTPKSLNKLLTENGFKLQKLKICSLDYQPKGWKKYLFIILVTFADLFKIGDQLLCVYERRF